MTTGVDRDRRRLLGAIAATCAAGLARPPAFGAGARRAVVARARRDGVVGAAGKLDPAKLDALLAAALARAGGATGAVAGLRSLFRPTDVVGIKVNTIAGKGLSPRPELVARLAALLQEAGVPARNILVWDRTDRELKSAGFALARDRGGVRCFGTDDDYDWTPREWGPGGSCFAKLLVNDITALINVGVVKDHDLAGVSFGLKNWYGVIHNPNKHHDDGCQPFIAHLAAYPLIRGKLRLTLIDGLTAQCHGGPAVSRKWQWPWGGVLASTDPVAVDAVGWSLVEARRKEVGLGTLASENRAPRYIAEAAKLGLGVADTGAIEVADV
ncbi:MAG: DUF362 domain-containing protein [Acidobacteria bacterium]|nr:DUF362 domain-containing protein [Acidobacteriota bacterium]